MAGRTTSILNGNCVKPPFGCGKPTEGFADKASEKEYAISGMCQNCQNEFYKNED